MIPNDSVRHDHTPTFNAQSVRAVLFDYGSTLIEFSQTQLNALDNALADVLEKHFGHLDRNRLAALREADRLTPYNDGYRENDLPAITRNLVCNLYDTEPNDDLVAEICRERYEAFVTCIQLPAYLSELLNKLQKKYRIGLVSNYPDGRAIRESLQRIGIANLFDIVVVSGDVGYV